VSTTAVARSLAAREYLQERRRRRRPSLFGIYIVIVAAVVFGVLGEHVLASIVGGGLGGHTVTVFGPALLAFAFVGAVRYGLWQGPVSFRVADVCLLLLAPLSIGSLVRPKLGHALTAATLAAAGLGAAIALLSAGGVAALGAPRSVATVVGLGACGALAVAVSWLVEASSTLAHRVARVGPWLIVGAAALFVAAAGRVAATVVMWSGPWGWAMAPLERRAGWPAATGLLVLVALTAVALARRRIEGPRAVTFLERARVRSGITTAAFVLDYRGVALVRRAAAGAGRRPAAGSWIPRPHAPAAAIPWRDVLALVRDRSRAGWAALVAAAAVAETVTHPGRGLPAAVAALGLYGAAALLCEPLRAEVDHPDRGAVLLSRTFAQLLIGHCATPALVLGAVAVGTLGALVGIGVAGPATLALAPTLLVACIAVAVLCAALATRRGGKIGPELLGQILSLDPSSPMVLLAVVWLAPWLLVAVTALTVAMALVGAAAAGHHPVLNITVTATSLLAIVAFVLLRIAARSPAPDS
jgi:hypothetical protein